MDIKMPQLGESVTEGTIGRWLKQVGDPVAKYEPLAEVVTDKVTAEVPSDVSGIVAELLVAEGDTVAVGTLICRVQEAGSVPSESLKEEAADSPKSVSATTAEVPAESKPPMPDKSMRGRYSPAVLRLAEEHDLDLNEVSGSGEGGRITRKDVLAHIANPPQSTSSVASSSPVDETVAAPTDTESKPAERLSHTAPSGDFEVVKPSPIRRTIAKRMVESKRNAPHAWTMVEADVTGLATYRDAHKSNFERTEGIKLTFLPFFIKVIAESLKKFPMLNSAWVGDEIRVMKHVHLSIAIATDDVLVVPVIHDADRLSVRGIAHELNRLASDARTGKLTVQDMEGGTFTVNNTGAFGSILSQPILNAPQAAILSVESVVKRPVVVQDMLAIRSMVNLCLSLDHRVLDGWVAGQFLKEVKHRLETTVDWSQY
ncbi:dihydrolipoamide acetyltransferase family protein [Alicyclobacillus sp. SP_1]|uniref:dihydrolipoamide acetyltransferase family protein n=1 Tax=Alicyclobacillus sp. SP_1 TaxID=2942475 RepID=UPI0021574CE1|nr:dihydrolipoamide acetyltransferase family protein [Alicyclobacillus sp. SP_1]